MEANSEMDVENEKMQAETKRWRLFSDVTEETVKQLAYDILKGKHFAKTVKNHGCAFDKKLTEKIADNIHNQLTNELNSIIVDDEIESKLNDLDRREKESSGDVGYKACMHTGEVQSDVRGAVIDIYEQKTAVLDSMKQQCQTENEALMQQLDEEMQKLAAANQKGRELDSEILAKFDTN